MSSFSYFHLIAVGGTWDALINVYFYFFFILCFYFLKVKKIFCFSNFLRYHHMTWRNKSKILLQSPKREKKKFDTIIKKLIIGNRNIIR